MKFFSSLFVITTLIFYKEVGHKIDNKLTTMPVLVTYKERQPPDSIQDFVKVYLQSKKIEVVDLDRMIAIYKEEIMSNAMKLMDNGKFNDKTAKTFHETPVGNILKIQIFSDTINEVEYKIDSIKWLTNVWPVVDAKENIKKFISSDSEKETPFSVLKLFLDRVIESRALK
jgi:hypothetical protein